MLATAGIKAEQNGPKFFEDALVPAWGKMGLKKSNFFFKFFFNSTAQLCSLASKDGRKKCIWLSARWKKGRSVIQTNQE